VIDITPPKELGEKYSAVIWKAEEVEGNYGPQIKVLLSEVPSGNIVALYLPTPATPKNRTGRVLTALNGTYPDGQYDEQSLVGMTVSMIYAQKKGGEPGDLVLDLLKPRDKAKGEDPQALVAEMLLNDANIADAPF